jgi:hypothetical protein
MEELLLFKEISKNCTQKIICKYSKKLENKISLKSSKDVENLRNLVFLLYIFNHIEYVNRIIKFTHENFNKINPKDRLVKEMIFAIWGLEIRLLRQKDEKEKINEIIMEIDSWLRKNRTEKMENERRKKIVLWEETGKIDITRNEMIKIWLDQEKIGHANNVRLLAISELIGYTETELYPILNENKNKIESIINEYKEEIKKSPK